MIYKKYKLSDVAKVEISSVDKKTKDGETHVKLCNFTDVYHNWAITTEMADNFMEATANAREIEKFTIRKGQVAFTKDSETRDDIGIPTYIADDFENVLLGYHCALITPDESKLSGKYLNAFMHSDYIQKYFELNATGSGMRYTLSLETLQSMPLLLPSLEEQKAIGDLFSSIDRKIALNRSINQNLEALAKQLYDYWFVQFDFPNENGQPYKSNGGKMVWNEYLKREIPKDWFVANYKELFTIGNGKTMPQIYGVFPAYGGNGKVKDVGESNYGPCIIIGRVGANCGSIHYSNVPCWVSDNAIAVCPIIDSWQPYLYYSLKLFNLAKNKGGSSQPLITHMTLKNLYFPISKEIVEKYACIANCLQNLIYSNQIEIIQLTKQRDKLLPLLMNGQVSLNSDLSNG